MENSTTKESFAIPIWIGWLINALAWVLFIATFNHIIEIFMGIMCALCTYTAYKHNVINTEPPLGIESLSAKNLIYTSAFNTLWMFAWGLGLFGSFNLPF
ncbi:MAG: hypothetical protein M3Q58_16285 [Bacteroidota bacterium]|nr:hypothetical protein [Bacteroidota bacterium]